MPFPRGAESTGGEDPIPYVSLKTKEEGKRACSCQLSCYLKKVTSVFGAWFRCIVKLTFQVEENTSADSCMQETVVESTRTRAWEGGGGEESGKGSAPAPTSNLWNPGAEPPPHPGRTYRQLTSQPHNNYMWQAGML